MGNKRVFELSYNAQSAACFDTECIRQGGYILKRFTDGYRYFPLGSKTTFVARSENVTEIGVHILTDHFLQPQKFIDKGKKAKVIPFGPENLKR